MKKILCLIFLLAISLLGCHNPAVEEDIDLQTLDYYTYLSDDNPLVTINVKDYGTMKLQLFPDVAINTVDNFIQYIQSGSYDGSSFHRIIEGFMVQGGIVDDTNCSIKGEFPSNGVANGLSHFRGVISMARTTVKDSATSQFFIVHEDSDFLNINYASFGGLVSGFYVLDELANLSTDQGDAPLEKVMINSMSIDLNGYQVGQVKCASD